MRPTVEKIPLNITYLTIVTVIAHTITLIITRLGMYIITTAIFITHCMT